MRFASARILTALFSHLDSIGVSPNDVADPACVRFVRRCFGSERLPARLPIEVLERCAAHLGEPLFGLKYAQALDPKLFGPISLFWRYAPSLRYSHRFSSRVLHMHHEGVLVSLSAKDRRASFIYRIEPELRRDARQFVETNLSFALRISRWILGPAWSPVRVAFAHQPATAGETYAGILNAPVEFGAPDDALIVEAADLDRRSPGYDAELLEFVERSLVAAAKREPLPFRQRLEKTIEDLIAVHNPRLAAAAAALGVSERTLQRRLAGEGLSFQTLLAEKRLQIVEQSRLAQARPSLSILAERTGYSDASAVSRFIRARSMRGPADAGGRERRLESDGLGSPDQAGAGHAQSRPGR